MKFDNTEVMNFDNALRGMRNPMNSWDKSDSYYGCDILNYRCNDCPEYACNGYEKNI
ncbi:hypothetical protein C823_007721 [Eubacterium plexicaudatum ASF492]|nr:hypothetical protein C823_007721 [Eubacterium plexicaudatum ASF492]